MAGSDSGFNRTNPAITNRYVESDSSDLLRRVQWRRRKQRQPLRLAARAANFELFEQQRRRHHRRWQPAISSRRAKRTERRAREAGNLALHVVVNVIVVADSREITQRTRIHTDDPGAANHLLAPIFGIDLVHQQRQSIACSRTAAIACEQLLEILLMQRSEEHTSEL